MSDLCVFTLFDHTTGKPRCTGIKDADNIKICDLYRPGAGKTISKIHKNEKIIKSIILNANAEKRDIIISDFQSHIKSFNLPIDNRHYNVFDVHLPDISPTNSQAKDYNIIKKILNKISNSKKREYQKVISNSAVVYQYLQEVGLSVNSVPEHPVWSQKTFSGRSKSSSFNVQGLSDNYHVIQQGGNDNEVLLMFDWICADIRIASFMSQDQLLNDAFAESDPYTVLMNEINIGSDVKITREECKRYLLKSINSMDFKSTALTDIYPQLGGWIQRCKTTISSGKSLHTVLGRNFRPSHAKNHLAVLNGVMQGSVAHAMQIVLRRIWEKLPNRIVSEIHDCIVISSPPEKDIIQSIIKLVVPIMLNPFQGYLDQNPKFPLNVSIGNKWKQWKVYKTYR